jgi:hypothetical protein
VKTVDFIEQNKREMEERKRINKARDEFDECISKIIGNDTMYLCIRIMGALACLSLLIMVIGGMSGIEIIKEIGCIGAGCGGGVVVVLYFIYIMIN